MTDLQKVILDNLIETLPQLYVEAYNYNHDEFEISIMATFKRRTIDRLNRHSNDQIATFATMPETLRMYDIKFYHHESIICRRSFPKCELELQCQREMANFNLSDPNFYEDLVDDVKKWLQYNRSVLPSYKLKWSRKRKKARS